MSACRGRYLALCKSVNHPTLHREMESATLCGMAKTNPWKKAREDAGFTQLEVAYEARAYLPERYWIDPTKLSRFENGGSAVLDPIALGVLAKLYGKNLRQLDSEAADELDQIRRTLDDLAGRRRKYAPRDSNPEPAAIRPAGSPGHESVTSATPAPEHSDSRAA